jgi:hypothetical protein
MFCSNTPPTQIPCHCDGTSFRRIPPIQKLASLRFENLMCIKQKKKENQKKTKKNKKEVNPQLRLRFIAEAMCAKQYRQLASDVDPQLRIGFVAGAVCARCGREGVDATLDNLFWTCEVQKKMRASFYSRRRGAVEKARCGRVMKLKMK